MNAVVTAVASVALAGLLALAAAAGAPLLLAATLLVGLAVAVGWAPLLALPSPRGTTALVAGTSGVAVAVVASTRGEPALRWLPAVMALGVLAAFGHQMLRRDGRPRLVESVSGALVGQVVVLMSATWVAVPPLVGHRGELVLVAATGLAAAGVATALPWPVRIRGAIALAAGAAFAALAAKFVEPVTAVQGAVLGLSLALVVTAFDRLLAHQPRARIQPAAFAVSAAPIAASGIVVYVVARLFIA